MKKRFLSLLIAIVVVIGLSVTLSITVSAATESVSYESMSWNESTKTVSSTTKTATATVVTASDTTLGQDGQTTFYVVNESLSITGGISVYGEVHLILKNVVYEMTGHVNIKEGASLHLHKATTEQYAGMLKAERVYVDGNGFYIHNANFDKSGSSENGIYLEHGDLVM